MTLRSNSFSSTVAAALAEDLGEAGDVTSRATIPAEAEASAALVVREAGVAAGIPIAAEAFRQVDETLHLEAAHADGDEINGGTVVATVRGSARSILSAERVALNFVGHLSGIATATRRLVQLVEGTGVAITDTRKTTPGLRAMEKMAVRLGGGTNHRFGLFDAVLIKDNHIASSGSIGRAVREARGAVGHTVTIEVEADTIEQVAAALEEGPDIIMLDNMDLETMARAVALVNSRCTLEASGGITETTIRAVAETGVDVISVGWLTHSAPSLDVALEFATS